MSLEQVYLSVRHRLDNASPDNFVVELHLQVIKHADAFLDVSAKEFCYGLGIQEAFGADFRKMKKLAPRLLAAGLNPEML